jgi:ABC-type multidrug transport system fused ATPase/permease subunit
LPSPSTRWYHRLVTQVPSTLPLALVLIGLASVFVADASIVLAENYSFAIIGWLAPILVTFGIFLQSGLAPRQALSRVTELGQKAEEMPSQDLEARLDMLNRCSDICNGAIKDNRSSTISFILMLLFAGVVYLLSQFITLLDLLGNQFATTATMGDLVRRLIVVDGPPIAAFAGIVGLLWSCDAWLKLREKYHYIRRKIEESTAKKRILDRFPKNYYEFADLTERINQFVERNDRLASSYATKNNWLLIIGILLSLLITAVGILGAAGLMKFNGNEFGSVISALLGAVVAAVVGVQNTFRMADRAAFQRRISSDGRTLLEQLLFSVHDDEQFNAVLSSFQKLNESSARDFPASRELEAPPGKDGEPTNTSAQHVQ